MRAHAMWALLLSLLVLFIAAPSASAAMTIESGPKWVVSEQQVTIWWHSSSTGSSELKWDTSAEAWADMAYDASNTATNLGTVHSRTINNLRAGTYYFRVRTNGAAGAVTSGAYKVVVDSMPTEEPIQTAATNGTANVSAMSADGETLYLGGTFTTVGKQTGSLAYVDSTTGTVTNGGQPTVTGYTYASIPDGNGGHYIGGTFNRVGGLLRPQIAHLLPDGGVDPYFTVDAAGTVYSFAIYGTTLYVGGAFTEMGGLTRNRVAAIDMTTNTVTSFDPGADNTVRQVVVDATGTKLYIGGAFLNAGGAVRSRIAEISTSTGLASAWNPGANNTVRSLVLSGTTLYVGGDFTLLGSVATTSRSRIGAVLTTTGAATAWDPGASAAVYTMTLNSGFIYAGGSFSLVGGGGTGSTTRNRIAKINATTAAIDAWDPNASNTVLTILVDGTDVYVGGWFLTMGGISRPSAARMTTTVATPTAWNPKSSEGAWTFVKTGTTILIGGDFASINMVNRSRLAAFDVLTGEPTAFVADVDNTVWGIAVAGTRLFVGGTFTTINGTGRTYLGAVNATTGVIDAWNPIANSSVLVMLHDAASSTLYVGGNFTAFNGTTRNRLASFNSGTTALNGFNPNVVGGGIYGMAADATNLYIGGDFTTIGGSGRSKVGAVVRSSGAVAAWNPGANAFANAIALDAAGNIYVGGDFTLIGGGGTGSTARNRVAKVTAAGAVDGAWNPNVDDVVESLLVYNSTVWIGGEFLNVGAVARDHLALVSTSNATLSAFAPEPDATVRSLTVYGTQIVATGSMRGDASATDPSGVAIFDQQARRNTTTDVPTVNLVNGPTYVSADSQYTVFWETDVSASSELVWSRSDVSYWDSFEGDASNYDTSLGTKHSRTVSNLAPGTYHYRIRSRTAAGAQWTSGTYTIRIESPGRWDPLGSTVVDGDVFSTELSADGSTLYLGGEFNSIGERTGSGLPLSTTTGRHSAGAPQVSGEVWTTISDGAGGFYIGGAFDRVGSQEHNNVAHILPDGGLDGSFRIDTTWDVYSLVLQGTTLYIGGRFDSVDGQTRGGLAAVNTTTNLLLPWNPGSNGQVTAMTSDGTTLFVGGTFTTIASQPRTRLAAFTMSTGAIVGWAPSFTGTSIDDMAYSASSVIVGGTYTNIGGQARVNLAGLNPSTGAATTFAPAPSGPVYAVIASGATVVVGGDFVTIGGQSRTNVAQLNPAVATGSPTSYAINIAPNRPVRSLAVTGSTLYFGGLYSKVGAVDRMNLASVDLTTNTLGSFNPNIGDSVRALALSGTTIYVGGQFTTTRATPRAGLAAIDTTTGNLKAWNPAATHATRQPYVYTLERNGTTLYVGGSFATVGGQTRANIAALSTTTGLATAWYPTSGASGVVRELHFDGSALYAGGYFTTIGGVAKSHLASLNPTTAALNAFTANTDGTYVDALVVAGGKLYVGGDFTTMNAVGRSFIAAVNPGTGANDAWNPGASGIVRALIADGTKLYAGGDFTTIAGQPRTGVAAFTITTGAIHAWNPVTNGNIWAIALDGAQVYIGGTFTTMNGSARWGAASIDAAAGTTNAAFAPDVDYAVQSFAFFDSRVFVGGGFASLGQQSISQGGFAMIDPCDRGTYCAGEALREYVSVSVNTSSINLGSVSVGTSATASSIVTVQSNGTKGYSLLVDDESDTDSLACTVGGCAGQAVPDWTGTNATPTTWAPADTGVGYGFGVTVLSTSVGSRLAKWGAGTSTVNDFAGNKYFGVDDGHVILHETNRFTSSAAETVTLGWRLRAPLTQGVGNFSVDERIFVVPNA